MRAWVPRARTVRAGARAASGRTGRHSGLPAAPFAGRSFGDRGSGHNPQRGWSLGPRSSPKTSPWAYGVRTHRRVHRSTQGSPRARREWTRTSAAGGTNPESGEPAPPDPRGPGRQGSFRGEMGGPRAESPGLEGRGPARRGEEGPTPRPPGLRGSAALTRWTRRPINKITFPGSQWPKRGDRRCLPPPRLLGRGRKVTLKGLPGSPSAPPSGPREIAQVIGLIERTSCPGASDAPPTLVSRPPRKREGGARDVFVASPRTHVFCSLFWVGRVDNVLS